MAKCNARKFCGRSTKPASALGASVDVLVVKTARGGACRDASRQNASLIGIDSGTDSLIRSASRTAAARSVVYVSASDGVVDLLTGRVAALR